MEWWNHIIIVVVMSITSNCLQRWAYGKWYSNWNIFGVTLFCAMVWSLIYATLGKNYGL